MRRLIVTIFLVLTVLVTVTQEVDMPKGAIPSKPKTYNTSLNATLGTSGGNPFTSSNIPTPKVVKPKPKQKQPLVNPLDAGMQSVLPQKKPSANLGAAPAWLGPNNPANPFITGGPGLTVGASQPPSNVSLVPQGAPNPFLGNLTAKIPDKWTWKPSDFQTPAWLQSPNLVADTSVNSLNNLYGTLSGAPPWLSPVGILPPLGDQASSPFGSYYGGWRRWGRGGGGGGYGGSNYIPAWMMGLNSWNAGE